MFKQYLRPKRAEAYVPTGKVEAGKFIISFNEIGALEAKNSVSVSTEIGGKIIYLVDDGKMVKAGETIAELDPTDLEREVYNQELAHENAEADVTRVKSELDILKESNATEIEQSRAQLDFDKTELERAQQQLEKKKRQAEEKLIPRSEVEQAEIEVRSKELAVLKGEKDYELKQKEVKSKEEQKAAEVRNMEYRAEMAKMQWEEAVRHRESTVIRAPGSGLVVLAKTWTAEGRRSFKEGDTPHPRQTICSIPDLTSMLVKVNVGESDAPKLIMGMPTVIKLEAVPDKVFHGAVEDISRLATEGRPWDSGSTPGRKTFEVTIVVKEVDPENLKPGMTADVEFIQDTVDDTVYVPIEAVNERAGKTYVFVKNGSRYDRVNVKLGKRNDNFVCVNTGVRKGQVVALRDPTRATEQEEETPKSENGEEEKSKPVPIPGANGKSNGNS